MRGCHSRHTPPNPEISSPDLRDFSRLCNGTCEASGGGVGVSELRPFVRGPTPTSKLDPKHAQRPPRARAAPLLPIRTTLQGVGASRLAAQPWASQNRLPGRPAVRLPSKPFPTTSRPAPRRKARMCICKGMRGRSARSVGAGDPWGVSPSKPPKFEQRRCQ